MLFYKHVRFMEGLTIYPITKVRYKRQDHVLGVEIGREDLGVKRPNDFLLVLGELSGFVFLFVIVSSVCELRLEGK